MRIRVFILKLILTVAMLSAVCVRAESLGALESIVSDYSSLGEFLADPKAVLKYREALKAYMGEGDSFNSVYDEFIRQIKDVNGKIDGFGAQAWEFNAGWQSEIFKIKGEFSGSGLEIKREAVLGAIDKIKNESKEQASKLVDEGLDRSKEIASLVEELKNTYGLLSETERSSLSRSKRGAYDQKIGKGDLEKGIPKFSDHPAAVKIASHLAHELMQRDGAFSDALNSGDADIIVHHLKKLRRPLDLQDLLQTSEIDIPKEILGYLTFSTPTATQLIKQYDAGVEDMKVFRKIADARMDEALLARLLALQAAGIPPDDFSQHLNEDEKKKLAEWKTSSSEIRARKLGHSKAYNSENDYFEYQLHEDPARGTLRLKSDTGTELWFKPSPRAFHAFFAGRKTGECVGGANCGNLTAKRWARAALKGTHNLFTETGDSKMEGMVAITRLKNTKNKKAYDVVDLMSRAMKGDIIFKDENESRVKFSFFDVFVDKYVPKPGGHGLIISDGNDVSQNILGAEVVNYSPAYLEDQVVGKPADFTPFDPMAESIARHFPRVLNGYGDGGMIYDGMKGDGTKVVRLVPTKERKKWTKEELEFSIGAKLLAKEAVTDRDVVWKRAKDSKVRLEPLKYYVAQFEDSSSPFYAQTLDKIIAGGDGSVETLKAIQNLPFRALAKEKFINPGFIAVIDKALHKFAGSDTALEAIKALRSAMLNYPTVKAYIAPSLIDGLRKNLVMKRMRGWAPIAAASARTLTTAIGNHPSAKHLVAPEVLEQVALAMKRGKLGDHVPSEDIAQTLLTAITHHPTNRSVVGPKVRDAIAHVLVHSRRPLAVERAAGVFLLAMEHHPGMKALAVPAIFDRLVSLSGESWVREFSGDRPVREIAEALVEALKLDPALGAKSLRKALHEPPPSYKRGYYPPQNKFPHEELSYALVKAWLANPAEPAFLDLVQDEFTGNSRSVKFASMVLSLAIEVSSDKAFIAPSLIAAMENSLLKKDSPIKYLRFPLEAALKKHPQDENLLKLLKKLLVTCNRAPYYEEIWSSSLAAQVLRFAIQKNPQERKLVSPEILEALITGMLEHPYENQNSIQTFWEIARVHPATLLLNENKKIAEWISKRPQLRAEAIKHLFEEPGNPLDLFRVARAVEEGNTGLSDVRVELEKRLEQNPDSTEADRKCSRFLHRLQGKYFRELK